jgi:chromosome segregation ATPase
VEAANKPHRVSENTLPRKRGSTYPTTDVDKKRAAPSEWVPADAGKPKVDRDVHPGEEVAALRERVESLEEMLDRRTRQLESERRDAANSHSFAKDLVKRLDAIQLDTQRLRDERREAEKRERQAVKEAREAAVELEEVRTTMEAKLAEAREIARALHAALMSLQVPLGDVPMAMAVPP